MPDLYETILREVRSIPYVRVTYSNVAERGESEEPYDRRGFIEVDFEGQKRVRWKRAYWNPVGVLYVLAERLVDPYEESFAGMDDIKQHLERNPAKKQVGEHSAVGNPVNGVPSFLIYEKETEYGIDQVSIRRKHRKAA